jgi:polyphosphate kinase
MWLAFNQRVLNEAKDDRNPLLERVFFVAVVGSNLDEFFMKRIGGLKQQVGAEVKKLTVDGMLSQEQIDACYIRYQVILAEQWQPGEKDDKRTVHKILIALAESRLAASMKGKKKKTGKSSLGRSG